MYYTVMVGRWWSSGGGRAKPGPTGTNRDQPGGFEARTGHPRQRGCLARPLNINSDRTGLPKMAYRKQAANLTVVINQEPKANWLVTTVNPAIAGK